MSTLLPRYRRLFAFGDVLDESVRLFREHWLGFAIVSAVAFLPSGLLLVGASAAGLLSNYLTFADLQSGRIQNDAFVVQQSTTLIIIGLVAGLFDLLWTAASVAAAHTYMHGQPVELRQIYARAGGRFLVILLASLLILLAMVGLTIAATLLFVVTIFGLLGSIVAIIAGLFFWLRPTARKPWVKWLIILATPFGLPTYYVIRWSMYVPAIVLEDTGVTAALRRSSELMQGHWFRVAGILTIASLIVGILLSVITSLVEIPLVVASLFRGQIGLNPAETAISQAVGIIVRILLASIGTIVYTLVFVDLRNRREGTDIEERLSQLEASPIAAND
jgi:hypothetical protein